MCAIKLAATVLILFPAIASAQPFNWSTQLQTSTADLKAAIGLSGECRSGGHAVPIAFVNSDTTTKADLFDPVVNKSYKVALVDSDDLSIDRDEGRQYVVDGIDKIVCTIGREATATAYSFEDRIFRIEVHFDRCETRDKTTSSVLSTADKLFVYSPCSGVDLTEKDFDTSIYQTVKVRNSYGYTRQGNPRFFNAQWSRFMSGEYQPVERNYVSDLWCSGGTEVQGQISRLNVSHRCLVDVDNADPSRWSATAIYEFFVAGIIWDDVKFHLTSNRLFIDMPAEQRAAKSMLPGLKATVEHIKSDIAKRMAAKKSRDSAVSEILGAGPPSRRPDGVQ